MSFNASGRAAFSAAAQAAYIATASVAAPAGIPAADVRSFTQDMRRVLVGRDHNARQTVGRGEISRLPSSDRHLRQMLGTDLRGDQLDACAVILQ
jgi:hypothetical protein